MQTTFFLLDHIGFHQEAQPLIRRADQGDHEGIVGRAREIARPIPRRHWILDGLGTDLGELQRLDSGPALTGFAFLVLLSQYLRPAALPTPGLRSVAAGALRLGWGEQETQLLSQGMAPTVLLKPDLVPDPMRRPQVSSDRRWADPGHYWWWLRPLNAYFTGWWTHEQSDVLWKRLVAERKKFEQLDVTGLALPHTPTPDGFRADYARTVDLFARAATTSNGLYYIVS